MSSAPANTSSSTGTTSSEQSSSSDKWWHLFFGGLLAINIVIFAFWAYDFVGPQANTAILLITIAFAVFMAFNIGGNDVANSFGTSVGAGTLSMKQALVVASVFEVSGAVLAGGEVTDTVRSGIVDLNAIHGLDPMEFAFIMMSALLGAAVWLLVATRMGWPVSTTHSIVGGIVGAALTVGFITGKGGWSMVQWDQIGQIAISWVLSPLLGGMVAFLLFGGIKKSILVYNDKASQQLQAIHQEKADLKAQHREEFEKLPEHEQISYTNAMLRDATTMRDADWERNDLESDYFRKLVDIESKVDDVRAHRALEAWVPGLAALGSVVISAMMLFKGLKNLHLGLSGLDNFLIMGMIATAVWLAVYIFARTLKRQDLDRSTFLLFSWMQVFTASAFAFSHGSNDIANALGPFVAILDVLRTNEISSESGVPLAVMATMGVALISGLWFIGRYVIQTVGSGLTKMHPASGFAAELSAAVVVMIASLLGLPVSSTHILIGAVLGVGIVNRAANWNLMKPIGLAWVITLPAAAAISAITVSILRVVFG
ncbi:MULTISPECIES: inorganic phosphate transporter [Corynebacterium]|uniref:Phosphate transporter n=1 Tax=Corynebacterium amycolatum TaxID=43765 RepID=A0AB38XUH0_CORAY|nr:MULTISPECIES: inorganic phosphate transporter [Corynebacterium]KAA9269774.1 inorganic phosphate transporter [Corynebacterium amycolatum]KAA9289985.1 inorganic phosphate transporter [Corynebacterium amycolatum]MBC6725216.1 inorganic phosphate transporter [Corynebacterium amycolatum]MBC6757714.1 inorganic phosphate transporter [Corynebacterium sp. LK24]MBU5623653.1 inorganic phosphate transporter [Corynebacterium amycolatum]